MSPISILEAFEDRDRTACYAIRKAVFCDEQGVSPALEFDGKDDGCRHYLVRGDDGDIGTARVRPLGDGVVKIERVAVLITQRNAGVGLLLMKRALSDARMDGFGTAVLNAQVRSGEFYRRLGFLQTGDEFEEAGIPHIRMTLDLTE